MENKVKSKFNQVESKMKPEHNHIIQGLLVGYAKVAQSYEKVKASPFVHRILTIEKAAKTECPTANEPQKTVSPTDFPKNTSKKNTVSMPKNVYEK
jgi:hypothetical protein